MIAPSLKPARIALLASASAGLAACGGLLQVAEIEGSGYSDGSATGYGSVYVNGTRFATNTATITVDGAPSTEDALAIGMQLQVDGDVLAGEATRIRYDRDIRGPIDAIDRPNLLSPDASLTVLGQTVVVDSRTHYVGADLGSLSTDNSVDISGLRSADGSLRATMIRLQRTFYTPGAERIDLEGPVAAVSGSTATVGTLQIDLTGTAPAGQVAVGDHLEVFGVQASRSGVLDADQAQRIAPARSSDGPQVQREGLVTAVNDDVLRLGALQVDVGSAARTDDSGLPVLAGSRVIVSGSLNPAGRVVARELTLLPATNMLLTGAVAAIDLQNAQLRVLGQTIQLLPHTQFIDDSGNDLRRFRTGDLSVGDTVELLTWQTNSDGLAAARLRRLDPATGVSLRGEASNIDAGARQLTLGGVPVRSTATTIYTDSEGNLETASQFFANIGNGTLIEAIGTGDGAGGLNAERLTRP